MFFSSIFSEQLKNKKMVTEPDLKELVHSMRSQRHPWMVEGLKQYQLAYDIIIKLFHDLL